MIPMNKFVLPNLSTKLRKSSSYSLSKIHKIQSYRVHKIKKHYFIQLFSIFPWNAFQYSPSCNSLTSSVVRQVCFGKCNDFHWKCKRSVFTENATTTYSIKPMRKCKQKTNDLLSQWCFCATCWICNEQVPFLWVKCFFVNCKSKQQLPQQHAGKLTLMLLLLSCGSGVTRMCCSATQCIMMPSLWEILLREYALCHVFTECFLTSNLLTWIFQP